MLATPMPVPQNPSISNLNVRYSRRSACDRCRAYKLRCQRDDRLGKPCERCAKSRLACTTTFDAGSTSALSATTSVQAQRLNAAQQQQQQQQQHQNNNGQIQVGVREHQTLLPSPERLHSPSDQRGRRHSNFSQLPNQQSHLSHSPPSLQEHNDGQFQHSSERETANAERTDNTGSENILLDPNPLGLDPMDFTLPDMSFDANDLNLLMVDHSPTRGDPGSTCRPSVGIGDDGPDMFGHQDDATLCGPGTNLGWASQGAHIDTACLDTGRDGRDFESDVLSASVDTQRFTSSYKDLLKLSLELVEDLEVLNTQAPLTARPSIAPLTCSSTQQQQPVNRVLNQTAKFWDIVKAMSITSIESCATGGTNASCASGGPSGSQTRSNSTASSGISLINLSSLRHGWANASLHGNGDLDSSSSTSASSSASLPSSTPGGRQDHLLMINLVMTYVNLLRNCRAVFTRLYHALQVTPSAESNAMLSLPSLQFGEFTLENNVIIQVKVLIELTSGMLQRIGNALGISTGSGSPSSPADRQYRLPFLNDPVAVSTREIILSQESMQGGVHGGDPPLMDIMSNLKRLLERR
jgi:hypothetical protein